MKDYSFLVGLVALAAAATVTMAYNVLHPRNAAKTGCFHA